MKNSILILTIFAITGSFSLNAQNNTSKFGLELTKFKVGINVGPYRGRTPETDGPFNQGIASFGQVYFPFQVSYSGSKSIESDEYTNKVFLLRPSIIVHLIDNGGLAYGGALQMSLKTFSNFYFEYQLGIVYLEANEGASPDLYDGTNLHHYLNLSKPLNQKLTLSLGFIHISKGGYNSKTSNQDVITLGLKYSF